MKGFRDGAPDSSARDVPIIEIPHDVVNEQILIAAALIDETARAALIAKLPSNLFIEASHAAIWTTLRSMHEQGIEFSIPTVYQACSDHVELAYLEQLQQSYPESPANLDHHASMLRWDAVRANAVRGPVTDLLRALRDPRSSKERVRSIARQISVAFSQSTDRQFMHDPVLLAQQHSDEMRQRAVWPLGIEGLDRFEDGSYRLVPGMAPGKITGLTAVSGAAKSVIASMIALNQARIGRRVLYGAWEMGAGPTLELMALMSLGWSRYSVSTGSLTDSEIDEFRSRMETIGNYVRFFDAPFSRQVTRRYSNDESLDELHRCVADSGAEITVLDMWERAIPDGSPDAERRALFRTQQIFVETGCHGLLVCQQRLKEIENRIDKRPTRSTILGSQAWVDISDTLLGLHRPGQWKPIDDDVLQILVLKQRYARWPLAVEGNWNGDLCTLTNCRSVQYDEIGDSGRFADDFLSGGKSRRR